MGALSNVAVCVLMGERGAVQCHVSVPCLSAWHAAQSVHHALLLVPHAPSARPASAVQTSISSSCPQPLSSAPHTPCRAAQRGRHCRLPQHQRAAGVLRGVRLRLPLSGPPARAAPAAGPSAPPSLRLHHRGRAPGRGVPVPPCSGRQGPGSHCQGGLSLCCLVLRAVQYEAAATDNTGREQGA